jgi:integrase
MRLFKRGRQVVLEYEFAGRRMHRSWPDREAMHQDLDAIFWLRDHGQPVYTLINTDHGQTALVQNIGPKGTILLQDFIEKQFEVNRMQALSPASRLREKQRLKQIKASLGQKKLHEIDAQVVEAFRNEYRKRAPSASGINHMIKPLKAIFKMATAWGYLRANPLRDVKLLKEPPGRVRFLTVEALRTLHTRARADVKPWIILAAYTGLRKSALHALTWSDINPDTRVLTVNNSKGRAYEVYLHDEVLKVLEVLPKSTTNLHVFQQRFDNRPFRRACTAAGLQNFHFHDLRHTYATWLRESGADPMTIAQLMGHRVAAMTGRYAHLTLAQMKRAIEKLPSLAAEENPQKIPQDQVSNILLKKAHA